MGSDMNLQTLLHTTVMRSTILVLLLDGLAESFPNGIQKLVFPTLLGTGRFAKIGLPWPDALGPFVGVIEITCGALIVAVLLTHLASIPLIIVVMIMAIISTKLPILVGHDVDIFDITVILRFCFWRIVHEARTNFCMCWAALRAD